MSDKTALLDVNILVALFDPMHAHHEAAHAWFGENRRHGWASCPLTENGVVRVLSNPSYPGRATTVADAISRLRSFKGQGLHSFWKDSLSICDRLFQPIHFKGHRQITDVYLLALAVENDGRLATFDRAISAPAVSGATPEHLALLSG